MMRNDDRRPPTPPFARETAAEKVRRAEDAWNTRDPGRVSLAYTGDHDPEKEGVSKKRPARLIDDLVGDVGKIGALGRDLCRKAERVRCPRAGDLHL